MYMNFAFASWETKDKIEPSKCTQDGSLHNVGMAHAHFFSTDQYRRLKDGKLTLKNIIVYFDSLVALGLETLCRKNWYMVRSAKYVSVVRCGMFVWLVESRDSETFWWKANIVPLASRDVEEEQIEQTEFDHNPFYCLSWSTAARTVSKGPLFVFFFSFWGQIHLYLSYRSSTSCTI